MGDIITYNRGSRAKLTPHFTRKEFDCKCGCAQTKHDVDLSTKLEQLRALFKSPITVTSAYRCPTHNKRVGGSSGSKHVKGQAADVKCANTNPVCFGIVAKELFPAVGIYWYGTSAFVHVDTRTVKATWLCDAASKYHYTTLQSFILPTVKRGSAGATNKAAIKMMQRLIGVAADGVFGNKTEQALKEMQNYYGITADGICGPVTWKHISGAIEYL